MKRRIILLLTFTLLLTSFSNYPITPFDDSINNVIGNRSYLEEFGFLPSISTNDKLRVKTHLAYAEKLLRNRNVGNLTTQQQTNRNTLINHLKDYHTAGNFPENHQYKNQRKPCFIDENGNICAVGYLVQQTLGRDAAEKINRQYQYATIYEMNTPELNNWVQTCGLTIEELAIIQPTYSPEMKLQGRAKKRYIRKRDKRAKKRQAYELERKKLDEKFKKK